MDFAALNEKQRQIVQELDKNILLLASAGTGKTNTLACRIANILEQKLAESEEIICLTFTNKACNEMQARIADMLGIAGKKIKIKTFHGFCYEILQQEAKNNTDLAVDFTIFDEADCLEIVRGLRYTKAYQENAMQALINLIKEYRGEYALFSDNPAHDYEQVLLRLKDEKQQRINDAAKMRGSHNQDLLMEFEAHCGEIIAEYDEILRENHAVDFTDLLNGAYQLLQKEDIAEFWCHRFKFWSVDEVQDTSRLEYKILTKMFGRANILVCGDFFQTIYEWRGSEPQLIYNDFAKTYQPMMMVFHENYRSTQTLLKASYGFLQNRFTEDVQSLFKEDAEAKSPVAGEAIEHKILPNTYVEASWIYNKLQALKPEDLAKVCILTRSNYYNQNLSHALLRIQKQRQEQWQAGERKQDFPLDFMLVDEFKFFRRQEIKDVMAALRLLINPQDSMSLVRLLKRFGRRIGPVALNTIQSAEYKEAGVRITDFLHPSAQKYNEPFEMLLRALEQGEVVVFDVEATGLDTARDEIIQIAAIKLDLHGNEKARLMHYVRPSRAVGISEQVHHISDAKLREEGLEPAEALQNFLSFAKGCVIVGHNVIFDLTILASQLTRLGLPPLEVPAVYDTLDIFRRFYPKLPNHKLEFLGEYCQVKHKSSHDAFDDICATGEILIYAVQKNILPLRDARRTYVSAYVKNFAPLADAFNSMRAEAANISLGELVTHAIVKLGIDKYYKNKNEAARLENLRSLVRQARSLEEKALSHYDALQAFLRLASLSNTELDLMLNEHPKIPIITVHQAKGSEFDTVFLAGLQEGVFPSKISIRNNSMNEEARLFYVAITRAKKRLYLSSAVDKNAVPCRFINAIPSEYIDIC